MSSQLRYRELKPYLAVDRLEELSGRYSGVLQLPLTLRWVPGERTYDISTTSGCCIAYQAVLSEGTREDLVMYLNPQRLIEIWPKLNLDRRIVELWESKFSELRGNWWSKKIS